MSADQLAILIKATPVFVVLLIAFGFMWFGDRKKNPKLNMIGFVFVFISVFVFFLQFPEYVELFSAWAAVAVALAAIALIAENRRIREETRKAREREEERESMRRRLDDVQHWINEVLIIVSESGGAPGTEADRRRRAAQARRIVSSKEWVMMEAGRLDSLYNSETKLTHEIGRLSHILEHTHPEHLHDERIGQELEDNCIKALKLISDLKAASKL